MTTNANPYVVPVATDSDDTGHVALETTLRAYEADVDIDGSGTLVRAETFNGAIPGPTFRLTVGQTVVVRLVNDLLHPTGIHWHGIELANYADGTEITQDGAAEAPAQVLGNGTPAGGTFLYKFTVTRPGLYWYHPHHHNSLNRLFRGMYGMIVVTEAGESNIVSNAANPNRLLPAETETMQVVLSDTTVCRTPGVPPPAGNDTRTYVDPTTLSANDRAEWMSGATNQLGPTPQALCEAAPTGSASDDSGNPGPSWNANFIPSGMRPSTVSPRAVEGQTVLTNGMNVGGRLGRPDLPGELVTVAGTPAPRGVLAGQGLRLQIVNCSVLRYFRLRLTYPDAAGNGVQVPIVRIGGEGGLLDNAILEGGTTGTLDTNYLAGEILLPPATRADVVVAIPALRPDNTPLPVNTVLTMWTRDYRRTGDVNPNNWAQLPTVPVMHFITTGTAGTTYTIATGDQNAPGTGAALRSTAGMPAVEDLLNPTVPPLTTSTLLNGPATPPAAPLRPAGFENANIKVKTGSAPTIDDVGGDFMPPVGLTFAQIEHNGSSRYAEENKLYELQVTNASAGNANHPFHLHGFSFQPISLAVRTGAVGTGSTGSYTWQYREFRDTIELPRNHTLTFRLKTGPRNLVNDVTPGGALGRWLFHCHIFFHHTRGMVGEFVVGTNDGTGNALEKPTVSVGGSWAYAPLGGPTVPPRKGKFFQRNGRKVGLAATLEDGVTNIGTLTYPPNVSSGDWQWDYTTPAVAPTPNQFYVYITATDEDGRKDQAVFRLQVGGPANTPWDTGDPHLRSVDGTRYDFQAAGEFVLLRDRESGMEIQVRQTPAETPPPITDDYSGLTACVSLNTAIAARVGRHRIAFQPKQRGQHRFFLDGKPENLTKEGIDLDGHRVVGFDLPDSDDELGLRVDFAHGAVLVVTPHVWTSYGIRYLDVQVANTQADEGIMGRIPKGTWLPTLPSGGTVGPRPDDLYERYVALYNTFADAWRVTDATSMFEYAPGTSTATFTDVDWPHAPPKCKKEPQGPQACKVKPGFQKPLKPIQKNIGLEEARRICRGVTLDGLHEACVFDVAATGDPEFAKNYRVTQELALHTTTVQIAGDKPRTQLGQPLIVTATVATLMKPGQSIPTGTVVFVIDGVPVSPPVTPDAYGRASYTAANLAIGDHVIRAAYTPHKPYHGSSSANLLHTVRKEVCPPTQPCPPNQPCPASPCPSWWKFFRVNGESVRAIAKWLHDCIDKVTPCCCGGDHSMADHPHDDHSHDDQRHDDQGHDDDHKH